MFYSIQRHHTVLLGDPDQKLIKIVRLLTEEVIPTFKVAEPLLSQRETNLLSHFRQDTCKLLGV